MSPREVEPVEIEADVDDNTGDRGMLSSPMRGFFEGGDALSESPSSPIELARFLTLSLFSGLAVATVAIFRTEVV